MMKENLKEFLSKVWWWVDYRLWQLTFFPYWIKEWLRLPVYCVITGVPQKGDGNRYTGHLGFYGTSLYLDGPVEETVPLLGVATPVFTVGEIVITWPGPNERELDGVERKPSKWNVSYEVYLTLRSALKRVHQIHRCIQNCIPELPKAPLGLVSSHEGHGCGLFEQNNYPTCDATWAHWDELESQLPPHCRELIEVLKKYEKEHRIRTDDYCSCCDSDEMTYE